MSIYRVFVLQEKDRRQYQRYDTELLQLVHILKKVNDTLKLKIALTKNEENGLWDFGIILLIYL